VATPNIKIEPNDGTLVTLLGIVSMNLHFRDIQLQIKEKDSSYPNKSLWPSMATVWTEADPAELSDRERAAIIDWAVQKTGLSPHLVVVRKYTA
jgi:hypothetical protein